MNLKYLIKHCAMCTEKTPHVAKDTTWKCMTCSYEDLKSAAIAVLGELAYKGINDLKHLPWLRRMLGLR